MQIIKALKYNVRFLLLIFGLLQATSAMANDDKAPSPSHSPAIITASIKPLQMIAEAVLGNRVQINRIVPDGADPHDYILRPSDAEKAVQGQLLIWLGPVAEPYLAQLTKRPAIAQLDISQVQGLLLLPQRRLMELDEKSKSNSDVLFDQHLWLAPENAILIAAAIAQKMGTLDPAHANLFTANAAQFNQKLTAKKPIWQASLNHHKTEYFIAYHDAYQYLEHAFGVNLATVLTLEPEIKPGAKHLLKVKLIAAEKHVHCFVTEPGFDPRLLEKVMPEKAKQIILDVHGSGINISENSYIELMDHLITSLSSCLADN